MIRFVGNTEIGKLVFDFSSVSRAIMATATMTRAIMAKSRDNRHFTLFLLFSIFGLKSIGLI